MRQIVLCGPHDAANAVTEIGIVGPVAVVTAGWQEREGEPVLPGVPTVELALHKRSMEVFASDPELATAYRARQTRLKLMQDFYRVRLDRAVSAAHTIEVRSAPPDLHAEESERSLELIRQIDRDHLARCRAVHDAFDAAWSAQRHAVARHIDELRAAIEPTKALVIAGGHVAVLINRLRLFGVLELIGERPIVAWSAGAMVLSERIVLFHDDPPHGEPISEVLEAGLGLAPGIVVLPDGNTRLRLDERDRVAAMAQRYAPATCVVLGPDARLSFEDGRIARSVAVEELDASGAVTLSRRSRASIQALRVPVPDRSPIARAFETLAAGPKTPEAIDAFLAAHSFPIVEGHAITFVYRGDAEAVHLKHWIYGLPASQSLARLDGTNVWHLTLDLPAGSRVEYKLEVVRGGHGEWIEDPLNPLRAHDPFGANSVVHAFGYVTPEWIQRDPDAPHGKIEDRVIDSNVFGRRHVSIYLPARYRPTRRYSLLVVHDGHDYMRYAALHAILDNLIHRREIPELIVALTTSPHRLVEYANDERHARFVTDELVPQLESTLPIDPTPQSRCLMGASFGAVAALTTAWRRPGCYGRLLLQSGSFAFTDVGERNHRGPLFDPIVQFMNRYRAEPVAVSERVFVSCGIYESLIYENRSLVPMLANTGMEVRYAESRDGHNWENWRDRLREGLSWLFPGPQLFVYE